MTDDDFLQRPWRVGRRVHRTLYCMSAEQASDADTLIGLMDTAEMAAHVARVHNAALAGILTTEEAQ